MGIIDYLISNIRKWQRELRKSESVESTELDTVPPSERSSRNSKSPSTLDTCPHSAARTRSREKLSVYGSATELTRRLLEELISSPPPSLSTAKPPSNV